MRLTALIQALEESSYSRKSDNTKVVQYLCTCIDWEDSQVKLKDTVDVTIPGEDLVRLGDATKVVGSVQVFDISEVRPPGQYGHRMRFTGRVVDQPAAERKNAQKSVPAAS